MKKILHTYPVERPGVICTAEPSTLLWVNRSKCLREVHWLDLTGKRPKPAEGKKIIHTQLGRIDDMCFIQNGNKQLLVAAKCDEGIFVYNTNTDTLEWKVVVAKRPEMKENMDVREITTDGHGHLFVSDGNNHCIHVYSLYGSYMKCLLKHDYTLYKPGAIRWCDKTSSLIAECYWKEKWSVKVINVQF